MTAPVAPAGHYFRVRRGDGHLGRAVFVHLMKDGMFWDSEVAFTCAICTSDRELNGETARHKIESAMRSLLREALSADEINSLIGDYPPKSITTTGETK